MTPDPQSSDRGALEIAERHERAASELIRETELQLYIDGVWVDSIGDARFDVRDPTTGIRLAMAQAGNAADIERAVTAAWRGYETWKTKSPAERQTILTEISDRVEARAEEFARLDSLDNGKPITEARGDIELVVDHFRYFAGAARTLEGKTVPVGRDQHVETIREPYGVVGQIIPWNFPLLMATWKLAPALAAGNAVVLKPAEETPLSLMEFVHEVGDLLPAGALNVVTGYGPEAGASLVEHPRVSKIAFTGSTEVGRGVMKGAANNLTDISLELGGKSPLIVFPDADVNRAVDVAIDAMFYNAGECCCAGTRLFVHDMLREQFVEEFAAAAEALVVGDPLLEKTDIGPKISATQVERTEQYIKLATEVGGQVVTGGGRPTDDRLGRGNFVLPTVIERAPHEARAAQEEIFGPVELVFGWNSYDRLIEQVNDVKFGLAAGIVTDDLTTARRAARDIEVGNVWVNQYNEFPAGQPFGGYKQSGIGRETARETIEAYTRTKTINFRVG
ncbi:aldehyde dehydrogenase family protein [Halomarina pelagica]|uniref:aldehyde dehydrogenase family protein n=1 Tax=Halomarina pelagica TaxID=2961599 RepID=UPI0020C2C34F|nr:aldehyde dehydrogenase family protein [Halomarina sp. BND7]